MDLTKLNKAQLDAVETLDGNLLILAGAGSGKTRVITYRIAYLIEKGVLPSRILALTFTNKAAREMRERLEDLLDKRDTFMWIGTFHSMCLRILRSNIDKLNYEKDFVIYDTYDQNVLVKECMKAEGISDKIKPSFFISKISELKNTLKPIDLNDEVKADKTMTQIVKVYQRYQSRLFSNNALDFDDIILCTIRLLQEFSEVRDFYQEKFLHVLVDEYQDTNYPQYVLIKLLSGKYHNLCVVGDDDQSIYTWRGADIRNILEFEKDQKDTKVIKLEQNYRSTETILNAAHDVIAHNIGRMDKKLWTKNGKGEAVCIKKLYSEKDEGIWVAKEIAGLIRNQGYCANDIAVLYRANAQSRAIEDAFVLNDVGYRVYGGMKFYDRREIKDLLSYLRVISNTGDNVSLKRIINVPKRGIGAKTIEKLEEYAEHTGKSIYEYLLQEPLTEISTKQRATLKHFIEMMETFRSMTLLLPLDELIVNVLNNTGYVAELKAEMTEEANNRLENLNEFLSVAKDFYENKEAEEGLSDFLANISLVTDQEEEDGEGKISLMTLHSAKGLEFEVVFMVGMEDGIFPVAGAVYNEMQLEEERRLCYVGMTRAKQLLYLSYATTRTLYGKTDFKILSRFVKDIDKKYLVGDLEDAYVKKETASLYEKYREKYKLQVRSKSEEEGTNEIQEISLGSKVRHKVFGAGTVVAQEKGVYTIVFDTKGIKKIDTKYVQLEVIELKF